MASSTESNVKTGYSVCTICDIGCQLRTTAKDGRVERVDAHDNPALRKNICYKGTAAPHIHNHEDRLRVPLKRVGERGEDKWEEISYEQAMDEIAERLRGVIDQYGPEAFSVATSGWNTQVTNGLDRRLDEPARLAELDLGRVALPGQHVGRQPVDLRLDALARLRQHELPRAARPQSA